MNTVGIDVGSSSIKTALMKFDDQGQSESLLSCDYEKIRKRNIKDVILESFKRTLQKHALQETDIEYVASTGEGELVDFRRGHFYSMTCHSRGALYLNPAVRAVMDLGALHSKVVLMDDRSKVLDYRMTSQCASGSGQFLENISRYLGVATEDIGELSLQADKPETVSGICAVLAETDVINMVSRGISTSNIIKGIHISMARRLVNLLRMIKAQGRVLATGGLAQDEGLLNTIQEMLDKEDKKIKILKHELSPFAGAIGAALWAGFRNVKLQGAEKSTRMIYGGIEVTQKRQLTSSLALGEVKKNIGSLFLENKSHYKTYHAFAERVNGKYFYWTWEDLVKDIFLVSQFLISKGLHTGDRVAFVTANSYFRLISEMAVMSLGLISVPVFAGYPKELISDLIEFSEIKMLFVDVFSQIRLLSFDQQLLELVIFKKPNESDFPRNLQEKITYLDASILQKKLTVSAEIEKRFREAKPHQTVLIMYTSGTTGFPKGVQLSHYNLLSQQKALELLWKPKAGMRFLCYLPWHHSFGGLFERFFAMSSGGCLAIDDSWGKNIDQLFKNFAEIRPQIYFSVPKVYQEIISRVLTSKEAEKIFFHPELKFIFTAAAPLSLSISNVFKSKKTPVVEGWGLTETSPCCTLTEMSLERVPGVVGFPMPGIEIKLNHENEILVKGPNVMSGYFKHDEATGKAFDEEGWFLTGDLGEISLHGLKIFSRKDMMFKLGNGEKVFPNMLEDKIKSYCRFVKHAYIFGKGQPYPLMLIFPNFELISGTDVKSQDLVKNWDGCVCPKSLCDFSGCLRACLKKLNNESQVKFEKIKGAVILNKELSIENLELTPSFKVVPHKIEEKYRAYIQVLEEHRYDMLPKDAYLVEATEE